MKDEIKNELLNRTPGNLDEHLSIVAKYSSELGELSQSLIQRAKEEMVVPNDNGYLIYNIKNDSFVCDDYYAKTPPVPSWIETQTHLMVLMVEEGDE